MAKPGIVQRKKMKRVAPTHPLLGCFFHDSMVQPVALGRMLNMLNTSFLRQVAHVALNLADEFSAPLFDIPMHAQILGKGEFTCTAMANAMTLCTVMPRISSYSCLGGDELGSVEFDTRV